MSWMGMDPVADANALERARQAPIDPDNLKPAWYAGAWKAPFTGIAATVNDLSLLGGDLAGVPAKGLDALFSTSVDDWNYEQRRKAYDAIRETKPDPRTTGILGEVIHGLFNVGSEAALGFVAGTLATGNPGVGLGAAVGLPALAQGYRTSVEAAYNDGVDPATALGMGAITGISTWAGLKIPVSIAPWKGLAYNAAVSGGANVGLGMVTRGATGNLLRERGYPEMAEQYKVLDETAIAIDLVMGGGFAALAHYGTRGAKAAETLQRDGLSGRPLPSDEVTAATASNALHVELDTAPGIPADPASRAAHVAQLTDAIESLLRGEPVVAKDPVTQANFVENPSATATRQAVAAAVNEHVAGDLDPMQRELAARGLPTDPTLYSLDRPATRGWDAIEGAQRAKPVRFTDNVRGMLDAWRETGDTAALIRELERLDGRLGERVERNQERARAEWVRGGEYLRERLLQAERRGEIPDGARALVEWLIDQNPDIAADLAVSIRKPRDAQSGIGGQYNAAARLLTLFKHQAGELTAVHEVLHHSERLLPADVQAAIRAEWLNRLRALELEAARRGDRLRLEFVDAVLEANLAGDYTRMRGLMRSFQDGALPLDLYQYLNPSEFWAENASSLVRDRAGAEGWVARARQWLAEFVEKARAAFGLSSDAAIIRGLDAVLRGEGAPAGRMLTQIGSLDALRRAAGPDAPGVGVARKNVNGLEPALRVRVPAKDAVMPPGGEPLLLAGTNAKNAGRQISAIGAILDKFPNAARSVLDWSRMMAYAFASRDVVIPPYAFIRDINSSGAMRKLRRLTAGQIADADHGFANAREFRAAYVGGEIDVETTGKLFMWSFLSRGVSPYTQEGLFIDAFKGVSKWIKKAAAGNFTRADFAEYSAWAKSVAEKGSGQPGAGATHNLNAFGRLFLFKMGQRNADGVSLLQQLHDLMSNPAQNGPAVRRWFIENAEGVGIDNKVVSFTLLVAGFPDVMVLDRVQIRQLYDDGRFADRNLYDGRKKDGQTVSGSALSNITYGARGLLIYEAIERALAKRIDNIYAALGRPQDASIGRYHWETWVADSAQEASHGTLDAILRSAKGDRAALQGVTAKEGEYGAFAYGARYGRNERGQPYFLWTDPGSGIEYKFSVDRFRAFLDAVKKGSREGVVPAGFKVQIDNVIAAAERRNAPASELRELRRYANAPWYERPEVNRERLSELAGQYGRRSAGAQEGARAVRAADAGEAVPDRAGRAERRAARDPASAALEDNPALSVVDQDGRELPASIALRRTDEAVARAEADAPGFEAAAACALRG